ncbi:MAG TPA: L,D-transpeptidase family protein [Polyangia bacterium]|jgi:hypothetical protein
MGEPALHFYPGRKRLRYVVDGKIVIEVEAWGGPAEEQPLRLNESMAEGPTNTGTFVIYGVVPYTTRSWTFSGIRWGSRLRLNPRDREDLLYEDGSGRWHSVRAKIGASKDDVLERVRILTGSLTLPDRWLLNDFGPQAIRYFRDRNRNRVLDGHERLEGEMFHTTPENEAEERAFYAAHPRSRARPPTTLFESHGCIHLAPFDKKALLALGAFRRGTTLIIHRYVELRP